MDDYGYNGGDLDPGAASLISEATEATAMTAVAAGGMIGNGDVTDRM